MKANKRIIGMIATVTAAVVLAVTLIVVVSKRISAEAQPNQTPNAALTPESAFSHESLSAATATSGPEPALDQETVIVQGTPLLGEVFTESPATEDPKVLITKELNNEKEPQTVFPQRNDLKHIDYKNVFQQPQGYSSWTTYWEIHMNVGDIVEIPVVEIGYALYLPYDFHTYTYSGYDPDVVSVCRITDFDESKFGEGWISNWDLYRIGQAYKDDPELAKAKKAEALEGHQLYFYSPTNFVLTALSEGSTFVRVKGVYVPTEDIESYGPVAVTESMQVIDMAVVVKVAAEGSDEYNANDSFFDRETAEESGRITCRKTILLPYLKKCGPDAGWTAYYELADQTGIVDHLETISDDSIVFNYFCDNGRISVKYDRNPAAESWDGFLAGVKTAVGGEYEPLSGADGEYLLIRGANHDYLLRNTGDGFLSLTLDKGVLETVGLDKLAVKRIDLGLSIQK